jgi:hypothetical protein
LLLATGLVAQTNTKDAFYLSTDVVFGNHSGATVGLNYLSQEKISFQLGIHSLLKKTDQHQGESIFWGKYDATDEFSGFHFLVGKVFPLEGSSRFILSVGVGSTNVKKAVSSQRNTSSFFGLQYSSINYEETQAFTYVFNPKFEFPFSKILGLSISPYFLGNKEQTIVGIGIGFILGAL